MVHLNNKMFAYADIDTYNFCLYQYQTLTWLVDTDIIMTPRFVANDILKLFAYTDIDTMF